MDPVSPLITLTMIHRYINRCFKKIRYKPFIYLQYHPHYHKQLHSKSVLVAYCFSCFPMYATFMILMNICEIVGISSRSFVSEPGYELSTYTVSVLQVMRALLAEMCLEIVRFVSEAILEVIIPAIFRFVRIYSHVSPVSGKSLTESERSSSTNLKVRKRGSSKSSRSCTAKSSSSRNGYVQSFLKKPVSPNYT